MKDKKENVDLCDCHVQELNPLPKFIDDRISLWDVWKKKYLEELQLKPKFPIQVTLPDGKVLDGTSWETSAYDIAKKIR